MFPLTPSTWHREMRYFTEGESAGKIIEDGDIRIVGSDAISTRLQRESVTTPWMVS